MRKWQGCTANSTLSRPPRLHQPALETWWGSASCHNCQLSKPEDCRLCNSGPLPAIVPPIPPPHAPLPTPIAVMTQLLKVPDGGQQVAMGVPGSCHKPCYKQIFRLPTDEYCSSSGCHVMQVHIHNCDCSFCIVAAASGSSSILGPDKAQRRMRRVI